MKKTLCVFLFLFLFVPIFAKAETRNYSVAGVTFTNNDGSSRQEILKEAYKKGGNFSKHSGSLKRYLYQEEDAIYVLLGDHIVGNIPAEDVSEVIGYIDDVESVYVTVSRFNADGDDLIYYARVGVSSDAISTVTSTPRATLKTEYKVSDVNSSDGVTLGASILIFVPVAVGIIFLLYIILKLTSEFLSRSNNQTSTPKVQVTGHLNTIDHERIIQTKEYISLENKLNIIDQANKKMKIIILVLFAATIVVIYLYSQSSKELRSTSQLLENAYDLNLDAEASYYTGYLDGQSASSLTYDNDISKAKDFAYENGYSSAMIEMESENDYADAYVDGFEDGWSSGYEEGYSYGYDDGYDLGRDSCYDNGYYDGYNDGSNE